MSRTPCNPCAVALWLLNNTKLTKLQISCFCGLHILSIDSIRSTIRPRDPVEIGYITHEDIKECELNHSKRLLIRDPVFEVKKKKKKNYYINKKHIPGCIVWMYRHYPDMSNAAVSRLLGISTSVIKRVKENIKSIDPINPISIRLVEEKDLPDRGKKIEIDHDPFEI